MSFAFAGLLLLSLATVSQGIFSTKPLIKNYGGNKLALPANYMGKILSNHELMFANANGVLKYDGTHWSLIPIKDSLEVVSILFKDSIIYIGSDNGQGIKPYLLNNIFDMFFRASDTFEGSGLGLYIVKDTVAKIGGIINVSSTYGTGTIFTIILNNEE